MPMTRFISVATLLSCTTFICSALKGDDIGQVVDTLNHLLQSFDEDQQKVQGFSEVHQSWCSNKLDAISGLISIERKNVTALLANLKESKAALEEAQGSVQQIEADLSLNQHTIQQTQDMQKLATKKDTSKVSNMLVQKKQVLKSLQDQRRMALPTLARLQANVAEGQRRISDQNESTDAASSFVQALKQDCSDRAKRSEQQVAVLQQQTQRVQSAVDALKGATDATDSDASDEQVSFIQQAAEDADGDLFNMVEDVSTSQKRTPLPLAAPHKHKAARRAKRHLSQMQATSQTDQQEWCRNEHSTNQLNQQQAKAMASQLAAEASDNGRMASQLDSDMQRVKSGTSMFDSLASEIANASAKEQSFLASHSKKQHVATKILAQVIAIVSDADLGQNTKQVVASLKLAQQQVQKNSFLSTSAKSLASMAQQVITARQQQLMDLQMFHERHVTQKMECEESQRSYESEADEAKAYMEKLSEICDVAAEQQQNNQHDVEMKALEDVKSAFGGSAESERASTRVLRGGSSTANRKLSPLERAAAAIGVDVNSD